MKKQKPGGVIDLTAERLRRDIETTAAEHGSGNGFAFRPFQFHGDEVGLVPIDDMPVCVVTDRERCEGLLMTREDAKAMGEELIKTAATEIPSDAS